ncbi:amino acid adenylation domain-containing protein [Paenibacillus cellulosilyticus]|uniref:Amino acid adenylation domain-containing protein n=1 Tax=Paenibacillus cellulosilyticus TaxID=375489 RepID=A0A2V2YWK4_9BACL|nr:AMP-binding protein [Paenibacillus cellulosilyticus]PWW06127.1 amino acid adenylation domain-containing protein [Paenibacillus cellulosilyticus]
MLHDYWMQHSDKLGDQLAIVASEHRLTYAEVRRVSEHYKEQLLEWGIGIGDRIIIDSAPCPEAVCLIIACSMAGAVFIPVSPDSPTGRIENIIEQTEAKLYVHSAASQRIFQALEPECLVAIIQGDELALSCPDRWQRSDSPSAGCLLDTDLAYIIFTSGTTGNPKGIMMSHRAAIAFFKGLVDYCKLPPSSRVGTIAPLQFDFSLLDMGLAFGSGGTLVQVPQVLVHHPKRLIDFLSVHHVYQMNGVPSIWSTTCNYGLGELSRLTHLRKILFAGEKFPINHLRMLQRAIPNLDQIINCFGQSESIACSFTDVPNPIPGNAENIPIGYAHPGAEILLFDNNQQPIIKPNTIGEMYVRGASLFSGYWKNEERTNRALVAHPLRPHAGERVFRTGDLAYIGDDGSLYYAGRTDNQVQIMGNRVELEEIERVIACHQAILDVAVVVQQGQKDELIAFVTVDKHHTITETALRVFCSSKLPKYMLPDKLLVVEALPYTLNGKIDKAALSKLALVQPI